MSKELEALKIGIPKLKKLYENNAKKMGKNDILGFDLTFAYLGKALQRLEAIENANPNEALSRIEDCLYEDPYADRNDVSYENDIVVIKQALIKAQEDKRFIELILNKPQLLNVFALDGVHTWEEFEDTFSDEDKEQINTTKEEYEYMRNQLIKRGKIE